MDIQFFNKILQVSSESGVSDIHLKAGAPISIRESGEIIPVMDFPVSQDDMKDIVRELLKNAPSRLLSNLNLETLENLNELDISYSLAGVGRFRVNIYEQRGSLAATLRVIPSKIPDFEELKLPEVLKDIAQEKRGMVLVTGITGSGKSTTLAAMLGFINDNFQKKIITIEDPIEFLIRDKKAFVSQREIGTDTNSFGNALRGALRQDPDIIMVGEMRDRETVEIALKAAETGHTLFSTLHTADSEGTITRLIGIFDSSEQNMVRIRLVDNLKAVISQRLVPKKDGTGRVAVLEIMRMTELIKERILFSDSKGFRDLVENGWNPYRMQSFDQHLTNLIRDEVISIETAMSYATSSSNLKRNLTFNNG